MDPNELIKAAPAIAKGAAEIIAAVPLADIVKRICGPPADLLGDKLKERVERCFEKTARMTQDAGFTPQAVPPKLLFPILQGASLEEDDDMHTMWAALLANAASAENADKVSPGFVAILKQMAPDEAKLLSMIVDSVPQGTYGITIFQLMKAEDDLGWPKVYGKIRQRIGHRFAAALDSLEAMLLVRRYYFSSDELSPSPSYASGNPIPFTFEITERGCAFMEACRPPKLKS